MSKTLFNMVPFMEALSPVKCVYTFFFTLCVKNYENELFCLQGSGAPVKFIWGILVPLFGVSKKPSFYSMTAEVYWVNLPGLLYFSFSCFISIL